MNKLLITLFIISLSLHTQDVLAVATSTKKVVTKKTITKTVVKPKLVAPKLPIIPAYTVSAWIPYWKGAQAVDEAVAHIDKIDIVSPFAYEVDETGVLQDKLKMYQEPFSKLVKAAKDKKKLLVPTILWTDKKAMQSVLSDEELRGVMIGDILKELDKYKADGIDIDFEGKSAETKDSYSAFIKEAAVAMHKKSKLLICTIESRIPLESRYATVTPELMRGIEYSNDFKVLAKACDQVRFMAYDQMTTDQKLIKEKGNSDAYKPVADVDWVEKVITLAMESFKWKSIVIGVPTYGNEYEIITSDNKAINMAVSDTSVALPSVQYKFKGSMNWYYADKKAKELGIIPTRNSAGELSYTFTENNHKYLVWYSDAKAIADKVKVAKAYKVGGVAIFKVDGNNDPEIWRKL